MSSKTGLRRKSAHLIVAGTLVALFAASFVIGTASSAGACSCARLPLADDVARAEGVYIARPRQVDLFPGASFRVLRVLKGPPVSNLRIKVKRGPGASCGTSVQHVDHVILTLRELRGPIPLSLCNQHLRGSVAVIQATSVLGTGKSVPRRPDLAWLAQWVILIGLAAVIALVRRRRRA